MAEFLEVMRQAKRLCKAFVDCDDCPFNDMLDAGKVEAVIMKWAEAHPEPRYPTWKEWQDTNFPNNNSLMRPCIFESEEYFECKLQIGCEKCINKPIPAEIAEKLGIKPIGGGER